MPYKSPRTPYQLPRNTLAIAYQEHSNAYSNQPESPSNTLATSLQPQCRVLPWQAPLTFSAENVHIYFFCL